MVVYTRSSSGWALCPVGRAYGYSSPTRFPCCVLLALSWNTTNENPSTDKLSRAYGYSNPQYAGNVRCAPMRLLYHVIVQAHGPKSREHRWMKKLWGQKSAPHGDSYCVQLVGTFALCLFYTNSYHL